MKRAPSILKSSASVLMHFIPFGWEIYDLATGDLNDDGEKDYAVIIQRHDSMRYVADEYFVSSYRDRLLIILLWQASTKNYILAFQNAEFIPTREGNMLANEPIEKIDIQNQQLKISLLHSVHLGSPDNWNHQMVYHFKMMDDDLKLINASNSCKMNRYNAYTNYYFDFLKMAVEITKGKTYSKRKKTTTRKLNSIEIKSIQTLGKAFTWKIDESFL